MNDDLMELSERMDRMESLLKTIQETMLGKTSNDDSSKRKDLTKSIVLKEATLSDLERRKIANVMENFDFYKVHKVMELLQWVWIACGEDGNSAVPSVGQMKAEAKRLLKFLDYVVALQPSEIAAIPPTSILREFIGGQTL